MIQRCPGDDSDRLTVVDADPSSSEKPEERSSTLLGVRGARLVALTDQRAAWAGPDGTLHVVGTSPDTADLVGTVDALGPAAGPTTDPPDLAATVRPVGPVLLWWTGTATVALDSGDLRPRWTVPGALGAGAAWPGSAPAAVALVPVPDGLAVLDAATGAPRGPTIPVARGSAGRYAGRGGRHGHHGGRAARLHGRRAAPAGLSSGGPMGSPTRPGPAPDAAE